MIDNVQDVTLVSDMISIKNGEEFIHHDVDRNKTWATKMAKESGASTEYFHSDNTSVFLNWFIWARIAFDSTNGRNRPYGHVDLYD